MDRNEADQRLALLRAYDKATRAVAVAATGLTSDDEARLFRFTLRHSVALAGVVGAMAMLLAYVFPTLVPVLPPK